MIGRQYSECRNVSARVQVDANGRIFPGFYVELRKPLPHLDGRIANNGIFRRVVGRISPKYAYTDDSLLELVASPSESFLNNVAQQRLAAPAVLELIAFEQTIQF